MKILFLSISLFFISVINSQNLDGKQLLEKAISYHDPYSKWNSFNSSFNVTMESPKRPIRKSKIELNLPSSFFRLKVNQNENIIESTLKKDKCILLFNGEENFTDEIKKEYRINCKRANILKDYYTYLYGLPMKLKDPGTIIDPIVQKTIVDGVEYYVLKVTYDEAVGNDTWYFFFDQNTYALKQYQFFHDESKNDGEYILLEDELEVNGIKMPKNRSWYFNSNDQFLGTDKLSIN